MFKNNYRDNDKIYLNTPYIKLKKCLTYNSVNAHFYIKYKLYIIYFNSKLNIQINVINQFNPITKSKPY